jgi:hypothetical protein
LNSLSSKARPRPVASGPPKQTSIEPPVQRSLIHSAVAARENFRLAQAVVGPKVCREARATWTTGSPDRRRPTGAGLPMRFAGFSARPIPAAVKPRRGQQRALRARRAGHAHGASLHDREGRPC